MYNDETEYPRGRFRYTSGGVTLVDDRGLKVCGIWVETVSGGDTLFESADGSVVYDRITGPGFVPAFDADQGLRINAGSGALGTVLYFASWK